MTPRILFIDHSGALGGAELYLLDVIRAYPRSTTVTFEHGAFPDRLQSEGRSVRTLSDVAALQRVKKQSGLRAILRAIPAVMQAMATLVRMALRHDLVYLNSQKALFPGALAGWLAGRPVVWNLHDILTADHFSVPLRRAAVLWANLFVDRVIVNSEATREAFVACGGYASRTRLVYNGIDAAPFEAVRPEEVAAVREEFGLNGAFCVGVFSRLASWKGQHVLLEALADLPGVHALFVGDAIFTGDEPYADGLRSTARALGIADRTHFAGFRSDVPRLMRAVDVVAHTSTAPEPFGRVIVEGLLAERPVVATRAGGAIEILTSTAGLLTPPGDGPALARALRRLQQEPETALQLARRGATMARRRFSIDGMRMSLDAVLHNLLKQEAHLPSPLVEP